ncbi:aminoglycoside phosphotransferase family protein [uncultured Microbacterium sp.]|uniref:aminoglycoside phosphotransferase family protein n=1 Tax=uncultured Microbacterium sp. TaxID=191216 RepID=UPI0028D0A26D|nr:aminoglycoside phosphotransferase family protein [uncultured Microbacterium sp.]
MADSPVAEITLDESEVRALLRTSAPRLGELSLRLVAAGWDNAVWRIGEDFALRLPRREAAVALVEHEQRALADVGPRLAAVGVRAPVPVLTGRPSDRFPWPWSIVPWIEGEHALGIERDENAGWAQTLAVVLAALHRTAPDDAPVNPVRGVPLRDRHHIMTERLRAASVPPVLAQAWHDGLDADPARERVWIHGDLHPGNIIVRDGVLFGLIDFGDVTAGDPAYDLAAAWLLFDGAGHAMFRRATRSRYDEATWVRARAWAAYLAVVFLTQMDDRPDFRGLGSSTALALAER